MKVYKSPQVRMDGKRIEYTFDRNKITASFDGVTDTFDLSTVKSTINPKTIRTTLAFNPIERIEYVNNDLEVMLTNFIGVDASEDERYPHFEEV